MRIITVAWEDSLSAKAFVSWYSNKFFPSDKPPVLMLSSLNSEDMLLNKYEGAKQSAVSALIVTIGLKKVHPDERIPGFLREESEFIIRLTRDMEALPVKIPKGYELLIEQWAEYVKSLAG